MHLQNVHYTPVRTVHYLPVPPRLLSFTATLFDSLWLIKCWNDSVCLWGLNVGLCGPDCESVWSCVCDVSTDQLVPSCNHVLSVIALASCFLFCLSVCVTLCLCCCPWWLVLPCACAVVLCLCCCPWPTGATMLLGDCLPYFSWWSC